ncbi:MAG: hypothetical protein JO021_12795 [Alphaproteobacteria bacterium]|nr:hypothetical protein [Alphaproteobacteria bacterium]
MSKRLWMLAAIVAIPLMASPASAHGGGHGGGSHGGGGFHGGAGFHDHGEFHHGFHRGGGVFIGGGFYDPYFYEPYGYGYAAPAPGVWYYCPPANAYYPAVTSCPVPWQPRGVP